MDVPSSSFIYISMLHLASAYNERNPFLRRFRGSLESGGRVDVLRMFYRNHLYGLCFTLIHRMPLEFHFVEIDTFEINASYGVIIRCLVVYLTIREVYG